MLIFCRNARGEDRYTTERFRGAHAHRRKGHGGERDGTVAFGLEELGQGGSGHDLECME